MIDNLIINVPFVSRYKLKVLVFQNILYWGVISNE